MWLAVAEVKKNHDNTTVKLQSPLIFLFFRHNHYEWFFCKFGKILSHLIDDVNWKREDDGVRAPTFKNIVGSQTKGGAHLSGTAKVKTLALDRPKCKKKKTLFYPYADHHGSWLHYILPPPKWPFETRRRCYPWWWISGHGQQR